MEASPLLCTLPPGRHGLPREFIEENYRQRLFNGMARAICEKGYLALTVADVTKAARVSRRTFYERFDGKEAAAKALVEFGSGFDAPNLNNGLGVLTVELVAMSLAGSPEGAAHAGSRAAEVCRELSESLGKATA